ncbi:MFS family permease [Sphingomonas zeicaulis]|uniref:MFS transporter n=1 Tax=Sphingomonas zeicaulis TaxID=1632740 RepID=UPI003D19F99D
MRLPDDTAPSPAGATVTPPTPRADFDAWWTLAVVTALYVIGYLDRFIVTLVVPDVQADLGLSDTRIGLILGPAFAIAYALFSLPSGWAADRYSRRMVILFGAALAGIATAFSGMATSFAMLLALRILVGVGESSLVPAALSLVTQKFPRDRLTTAISIFSMGPKVGIAVALALGGVIVSLAGVLAADVPAFRGVDAWRLVFILTGVPSLLIGFLCLTFREPALAAPRSGASPAQAGALRFIAAQWRLFVPMLVGIGAMMVCGQSLVAWVPSHLHRAFAWEPIGYGPLLGLVSAIGAGSLVIKGMIMDRLFARGIGDIHLRFYTWLLIATYPAGVVTFLATGRALFFLCYALISIIAIPCLAYASVTIQMVTPAAMRGRVLAILSVPLAIIGGFGPPLVGRLTDGLFADPAKLGWSLALVVGVSVPIAIVALRLALPGLRRAIDENRSATAS